MIKNEGGLDANVNPAISRKWIKRALWVLGIILLIGFFARGCSGQGAKPETGTGDGDLIEVATRPTRLAIKPIESIGVERYEAASSKPQGYEEILYLRFERGNRGRVTTTTASWDLEPGVRYLLDGNDSTPHIAHLGFEPDVSATIRWVRLKDGWGAERRPQEITEYLTPEVRYSPEGGLGNFDPQRIASLETVYTLVVDEATRATLTLRKED